MNPYLDHPDGADIVAELAELGLGDNLSYFVFASVEMTRRDFKKRKQHTPKQEERCLERIQNAVTEIKTLMRELDLPQYPVFYLPGPITKFSDKLWKELDDVTFIQMIDQFNNIAAREVQTPPITRINSSHAEFSVAAQSMAKELNFLTGKVPKATIDRMMQVHFPESDHNYDRIKKILARY